MSKQKNIALYSLTVFIILFSFVSLGFGIFYRDSGVPFDFTNQFGDVVKIYGNGIYANNSFFKAPILKGSDFVALFLLLPILIFSLISDYRKHTLSSRVFLTSVLSYFLYHNISVAFGTMYNQFFLLYLLLFSVSLFAVIIALTSIDFSAFPEKVKTIFPSRGLTVFLFISGIALFGAWLPEVITGLINNRPITMIEVYSTEVTFLLDMGVISPLIFICFYLLTKRNGLGYALLGILLFSCTAIGIVVISQSVFQLMDGIVLSIADSLTKVAIFSLLAIFGFVFQLKLYKNMKQPTI